MQAELRLSTYWMGWATEVRLQVRIPGPVKLEPKECLYSLEVVLAIAQGCQKRWETLLPRSQGKPRPSNVKFLRRHRRKTPHISSCIFPKTQISVVSSFAICLLVYSKMRVRVRGSSNLSCSSALRAPRTTKA
ncbi:uncharacterized protein LMH87_007568 [Akanthomyces muscarius]|uniref:Uncharacterized protein n=1 Tax=Akanthomyces muscarius TaxID=2231603 RepID=A0A9W8QME8_AKAMU|nr:uncharacterized protein LMH87_007568 [Akanthomyces muscarius]KAJ4161533.1 hypothetical protein LMH87_007568 [Akanthomyces muscarius]